MNVKSLLLACAVLVGTCTQAGVPALADHPWRGKQVAFLGDSITDPHQKHPLYWDVLAEELDIVPRVYGHSGDRWGDILAQAQKLKAEHPDVDAIVIFVGTNDFMGAVPLGAWYAVVNEPVVSRGSPTVRARRHVLLDKETVRGNVNRAMSYLKREFPLAQIVLLTPIHRAYAWFSETNVQPDESYANALGLWVDSYVNVVKEAGNVWAVPVVDLNATSGLYPLEKEHHRFFRVSGDARDARYTDYLHPNEAGHRRIGETLVRAFFALPCGFDTESK